MFAQTSIFLIKLRKQWTNKDRGPGKMPRSILIYLWESAFKESRKLLQRREVDSSVTYSDAAIKMK
jgi:hypothetical protein